VSCRRWPDEPGRAWAGQQGADGHLAVVGSHSTNGVAAIHSGLLRSVVLKDFAEMFPERFNNKTNGDTPRRWLTRFSRGLITDTIGDGWVTDMEQLRKLIPLADDAGFRELFWKAKRDAKARLASWFPSTSGHVVDPETMFDSQIKRIHAGALIIRPFRPPVRVWPL
jgi:starch phosphorylase